MVSSSEVLGGQWSAEKLLNSGRNLLGLIRAEHVARTWNDFRLNARN
jgi:hypothetical protein